MNASSLGYLIVRAGSGHNDKLHFLYYFAPAMPSSNFREGIGADQEIQRVPGASGRPQFLYRSDGITPFRSLIEKRWFESPNIFAGEFYHPVSMLEGCAGPCFVRRICGRNYQDFINIEFVSRRFRNG